MWSRTRTRLARCRTRVCDVDQQLLRGRALVALAGETRAICVSSAARFEARQEGKLGREGRKNRSRVNEGRERRVEARDVRVETGHVELVGALGTSCGRRCSIPRLQRVHTLQRGLCMLAQIVGRDGSVEMCRSRWCRASKYLQSLHWLSPSVPHQRHQRIKENRQSKTAQFHSTQLFNHT